MNEREFKRSMRREKWKVIFTTNPADLIAAYIIAFLFTGHGPFYIPPSRGETKK